MSILRISLFFILISAVTSTIRGEISVSYTTPVIEGAIKVTPPSSSGINGGIYVVPTVNGLRISSISANPAQTKWLKYSAMGAAYAEELAPTGHNDSSSWLDSPQGDMGYVIVDGDISTYIWLIDYSAHEFAPESIIPAQEQECGTTTLDCTGRGDEMAYYSITGRRLTLSREIELSYNTLAWDDSSSDYTETKVSQNLDYLSSIIHVEAPLCSTDFTLEGDRFLREWGKAKTIVSPVVPPHSISAHCTVVADETTSDNEISSGQPGTLGGSAPRTILFSAEVTEGAIFHEWQLSHYPDFDDVYMRAQELDFSHTFNELGVTYVRLYCANSDASCEYFSETYEVVIGESMLKCPNAFTPFNQDGVNDIWKVTYSSIIDFECSIFNRSGHKIFSYTDPSSGWDGKYSGKFVPAGVYYYVIKARGSDGKEYKLSGDINILNYK